MRELTDLQKELIEESIAHFAGSVACACCDSLDEARKFKQKFMTTFAMEPESRADWQRKLRFIAEDAIALLKEADHDA